MYARCKFVAVLQALMANVQRPRKCLSCHTDKLYEGAEISLRPFLAATIVYAHHCGLWLLVVYAFSALLFACHIQHNCILLSLISILYKIFLALIFRRLLATLLSFCSEKLLLCLPHRAIILLLHLRRLSRYSYLAQKGD